jgi:hypothetical protein
MFAQPKSGELAETRHLDDSLLVETEISSSVTRMPKGFKRYSSDDTHEG